MDSGICLYSHESINDSNEIWSDDEFVCSKISELWNWFVVCNKLMKSFLSDANEMLFNSLFGSYTFPFKIHFNYIFKTSFLNSKLRLNS